MNTEKSIKLMKVIKEILPEHYNFDFGKPEIDDVIKRLQMWEELYAILANPEWTEINVLLTMKDLEEKYFPKQKIRRTIEVEVLVDDEDVIHDIATAIENLNGQRFSAGKGRILNTRWVRE